MSYYPMKIIYYGESTYFIEDYYCSISSLLLMGKPEPQFITSKWGLDSASLAWKVHTR